MQAMTLLITTFSGEVGESRLEYLALWLEQTAPVGLRDLDCRFDHDAEEHLRAHVPEGLSDERLADLCSDIDQALGRLVPQLAPRTARVGS
jgi:hypothetical protein